jgi:hypothetical protein
MYEESSGRSGRREDRPGHIERQSGRPDNYDSRSDGSSESDGQDSDSGVEQVKSYGQNGVSIDLSPGKKFLFLYEEEFGGGRLVEACGGGRRSTRFSEF